MEKSGTKSNPYSSSFPFHLDLHCTTSLKVQELLVLSFQGNGQAREELFIRSLDRLRAMARQMFHKFPKLLTLEQTDDILNKAVLRLHRALDEVRPPNARAFFGLASLQMRRVLTDLCRYYAHRTIKFISIPPVPSQGGRPLDLEEWSEFHQAIDRMEPKDQELFHLLFYQALSVVEVAEMLGESTSKLRRNWREARVRLSILLDSQYPKLDNEFPMISPGDLS